MIENFQKYKINNREREEIENTPLIHINRFLHNAK